MKKKATGEGLKEILLGKQNNNSKQSNKSIQKKHSIHSKQSIQSVHDTKKKGLKSGWTRATLIIKEDYLKKIKRIAWWDRKKIKDVVDEALKKYLKNKKINQSK